jgi:hypothetical protein
MKYFPVSLRFPCAALLAAMRTSGGACLISTCKHRLAFGLLAVATCLPLAPRAFGQIQSTVTCPAGHGYWDVLSVMMMDPGLATSHHMEGITNGLPSAYIYTRWDQSERRVYYVKNPGTSISTIQITFTNGSPNWISGRESITGTIRPVARNSTAGVRVLHLTSPCAGPHDAWFQEKTTVHSGIHRPPPSLTIRTITPTSIRGWKVIHRISAIPSWRSNTPGHLPLPTTAQIRHNRFPLQPCPSNIPIAVLPRTSTPASSVKSSSMVWIQTSILWTI